MMSDGVFQASEATTVEKGWLQSGVTQRRGAKLIPILGQPSHLFQAKVFVGSGTIEGNIANSRRDLRHADHVLFEIAEHLIGLARHGMTLDSRWRRRGEVRLLARAIVLGLEVLGEGPCADGHPSFESILVGRTEVNPAIETAQCCFLRSGGEAEKTAPNSRQEIRTSCE